MATVLSKKGVSDSTEFSLGGVNPTESLPASSSSAHSKAAQIIEQQLEQPKTSKKLLSATPQPSSGKSFFGNPYVITALGAGAFIALGTTARVLLGSTESAGPLEFQPYLEQKPPTPTPYFDVSELNVGGRRLFTTGCPGGLGYAYPNGVTGVVTTGVNQGESVIIPSATGGQTVTVWVENPTTTPQIQLTVDKKDGTQATAPTTINVAGDGPVNFVSGARFGNGNIAVCYGSYPSTGTAKMQFLVLSPDGSTILSRTTPVTISGGLAPEITCTPLTNGNVQTSILYGPSVKLAEVDSTGTAVGTAVTVTGLPSGSPTRATSAGQYSTGQQLWVLNDPTAGLQARVLNSGTVSFTSNLIRSGEAPDPDFDQVTVNTASGPVTFWKTTADNLHAGRVNPTTGAVTYTVIDSSGSVEFAQVASSYNPSNPNQPGHIAVVTNDGSTSSVQILDANTLTPIGCSTPITIAGSTAEPSVAFYPDGQTLRIEAQGTGNFRLEDFNLDGPPILISGPSGNQTTYSNSSSTTTYTYPVVGEDAGGNDVDIYLYGNHPYVTTSGGDIVVQVTPDMVGTSFNLDYTVENPFEQKALTNGTCTFTVPDRLPVVGNVVLPKADAGKYYSYELPADTFGELDGQVTTQTLTNLPQGLEYTSGTPGISGGVIKGVPLSQTADTMTEAQTFPILFNNKQTVNGLTTTRSFNLTVDAPDEPGASASSQPFTIPPEVAGHGGGSLKGVYAGLTYAISAVSVASILGRLAISGRIISYQVGPKWRAHKDDPTFCGIPLQRMGSVVGTCLKTLWDQTEARKDLETNQGIKLNWRGGLVKEDGDLEVNGSPDKKGNIKGLSKSSRMEPLLQQDADDSGKSDSPPSTSDEII